MATAALQGLSQHPQAATPPGSYATTSSARQYASQLQNQEAYYSHQSPSGGAASHDSTPQSQYYAPQQSGRSHQSATAQNAIDAARSRNQPSVPDQYDGAPVPPPRTSSQQTDPPLPAHAGSRTATSRERQDASNAQAYSSPAHDYGAQYSEPRRERMRDDAATAASTGSGRSRRKDPSTPEAQRAARTGTTSNPSSAPPPLVREHSEVINRVVVSDPQVDVERMEERIAESRPAPIGSDVTPVAGLGLVGDEGVEDGGRGTAKRQDYSKSSSRRKDVQFGDYMLGQTLGEGEFGKVKLGWKKDGSSQVAIKLIRRETVATNPSRLPKIYREISILRDLAHPNIVRLHEMVETERHIGIILEYASGGELFDYILNHRYLKDHGARRLFAQLVSGVGYLHKKGIVHRDLKLENLLLDQNRNIIITDFGFANTFNPADELSDEIEYNLGSKEFVRKYKLDRLDERGMRKGDLMQTSCGSPCYAAPELVVSDSLYTGRKVDVWSCGVILYAMLAGYLPFDDDPANPEGDNINLLYKYITTTPLTFPDYVTPHARDLLRRILVPDPRKRADLFEVARHSWLSEYHHVVSHITSSTTNIADIANSTVPAESPEASPTLARSASVREPTKTSPGGALKQHGNLPNDEDLESSSSKREKWSRHTLQPEYVAPQTHTARAPAPSAGAANTTGHTRSSSQAQGTASGQVYHYSKPLPQEPSSQADYSPVTGSQQKMPPPVRPARDVPRSVSDSTGAFGVAPVTTQQQVTQPTARTNTGESPVSASVLSGTRSDLRLPSRGSYGQPVAPTVATTTAQGKVTQPKPTRGYNISGPMPQQTGHASIGQPMTQPMPARYDGSTQQQEKGHHRRSSTLSGLGERFFGRSSSVKRRQDGGDGARQRTGKKYPPTSMKEPYPSDNQPRLSTESKRSFLGLGKKTSQDLDSGEERPKRWSSLLPTSLSFRGLVGGNKDQSSEADSPLVTEFPLPPITKVSSRPPTEGSGHRAPVAMSNDGVAEQPSRTSKVNNFSRPPPPVQPQQYLQTYQQPAAQNPNDVYGGTGVYTTNSNTQDGSYVPAGGYQDRQYRQPATQQTALQRPLYPEGFNSFEKGRSSMQQGRPGKGVLTKNNRKFTDGYDNDVQHGSSSGAVKKVQDFFRRRGRARADSEYR